MVKTDKGPVPVDWLSAGDLICTMDHGFQKLAWIGRCNGDWGRGRCIRIAPSTFGERSPKSDILVSVSQEVFLQGDMFELCTGEPEVLATAAQINRWPGVSLQSVPENTPFYCLMFHRQEIFCCDGLWLASLSEPPMACDQTSGSSAERLVALQSDLDGSFFAARPRVTDREVAIATPRATALQIPALHDYSFEIAASGSR